MGRKGYCNITDCQYNDFVNKGFCNIPDEELPIGGCPAHATAKKAQPSSDPQSEPGCTQCWGRGFVFATPKYHSKSPMDSDYITDPIYVQVSCEKCQGHSEAPS